MNFSEHLNKLETGTDLPTALLSEDIEPLFWPPSRQGVSSAWWGHVPFAHWLMSVSRPRLFVELGTFAGVSYSAFCEAVLKQRLDTKCYAVDTWMGDGHTGPYQESVYEDLRRFNAGRFGAFSELIRAGFSDALQHFQDRSVDILHIDGYHTYDAVRGDFYDWLPKLSDRAVVLFHDTNVRKEDFGVWKLWLELSERYPSFEFLHGHGLGLIATGSRPPEGVIDLVSLKEPEAIATFRDRFAFLGARWSNEAEFSGQLDHERQQRLTESERNAALTVRLEEQRQSLAAEEARARALESAEQHSAARIRDLDRELSAARRTVSLLEDAHDSFVAEKGKLFTLQARAEVLASDLSAECARREHLLREAEGRLEAIRSSRSWRVTRPLRSVGWRARQTTALIDLLSDYRRTHSGLAGWARLFLRAAGTLRADGIKGLRQLARQYQERRFARNPEYALEDAQKNLQSILRLDPIDNFVSTMDVAVHVHLYYVELLAEFESYLRNIPFSYSLYVTASSLADRDSAEQALARLPNLRSAEFRVVENRGRDIAPMLVGLRQELARHELVLHIHTKVSPHNPELRGWRTYNLDALLGSANLIRAIAQLFAADEQLGLLSPIAYFPVQALMHEGGNLAIMHELSRRIGENLWQHAGVAKSTFPAGSMFWIRGAVLRKMQTLNLDLNDFDIENGQTDGTLAHAIERMFPVFTAAEGFQTRCYLPSDLFDAVVPGTVALGRAKLKDIIGPKAGAWLIFDHNYGGGTSIYSRRLVDQAVEKSGAAIRVYFSDSSCAWIVQIIAASSGSYFSTKSLEAITSALEGVNCTKIIINSLVGAPNQELLIAAIVGLSRKHGIGVDYKAHDFYALCPSLHLWDATDRYCGIPGDDAVCQRCLLTNPNSQWPGGEAHASISEWRARFQTLFDAASEVTVFDPSGLELLQRKFTINHAAMVPHSETVSSDRIDVPADFHIGVLGTLTPIKGAHVLNDLASFVRTKGWHIPITVVGRSIVDLDPLINVTGAYERRDLPSLIRRLGISVVFVASVVPETFSFVFSEAKAMGLPIVAFGIGAQGRRAAEYEHGQVLPLGVPPAVILNTLHEAWKSARSEARSC